MRSLIWKEWRENLKWVPVPGLVLLAVFLIDRPDEPMLGSMDAYFFCVTVVIFGAALGFVQIFLEARGDKRSVLLHRPISPSRIFLAKALSGVGLYVLAVGIPFACLEIWMATPGNLAAPYHWRTSLPRLADILSGLVYYFAGMLVAQRDVRWYGSRVLPLAAAFVCSYLTWALPEFWLALTAIAIVGSIVAVAAWGSFCTGGAYPPLPRLAKTALAMTCLAGLLILSMLGKQLVAEALDPVMHYQVDIDRQGRVFFNASKEGGGEMAIIDVGGRDASYLKAERYWRAESALLEWPVHWGYRHNGRFYVGCRNNSNPGNERWYYDHAEGRLLGYDRYHHHFLGSFGPEGFTPAGQPTGERFQGAFCYITNRWQYITAEHLIVPDGVYHVDFARRSIHKLFAPAPGETVVIARRWWDDSQGKGALVVVSTDKAFHVVTEEGTPVVSMPRAFSSEKYGPVFVGRFENPHRYFVWYHLRLWLREPYEYRTEPSCLLEYDTAGRELTRRSVPPYPYPAASFAEALYGLVTPMTEATTLVEASQYVRSMERSKGSIQKSSLLDYLESTQYYVPGTSTLATATSPATQPPAGLIPGYVALSLTSAACCALGCFLMARRHAFARAGRIGWMTIGFVFGWAGLVLMLVLREWPARIPCPKCHKLRVVTRDRCEHCGVMHAAPAMDGTEIFESDATFAPVALVASS